MDSSDPDLEVIDGVCNHCRAYIKNEATRIAEKPNWPKVLESLKSKGEYDCILGLSGGVDSSMALHLIVEQGLRPLTFTVDNGWNDPLADENIMKLVETLEVPFIRYNLDLDKFKELQAAFVQSGTANLEIVTDHVLGAVTYELAKEYGIKNIISGGNHATENVMPKAWGHSAYDLVFIKNVYKTFFKKKLKGLPLLPLWKYNYYKWLKGFTITYPLDYVEYNRNESKKLLAEKYGWADYGDKHEESVWTKWFQNFYLFEKFGYDKRKAHLSALINSGQITREEAVRIVQQPPIYPRLGIEKKVMTFPKKTYKDYKNSEWAFNLIGTIVRTLRRWRF